ncbi:hypothetical protein [Sphingobium sp.]|uniref:hypothetical protein n=1 Tax=Sphingobium sp. TaxID=1912891 RepID=UPI0035C6EC52
MRDHLPGRRFPDVTDALFERGKVGVGQLLAAALTKEVGKDHQLAHLHHMASLWKLARNTVLLPGLSAVRDHGQTLLAFFQPDHLLQMRRDEWRIALRDPLGVLIHSEDRRISFDVFQQDGGFS